MDETTTGAVERSHPGFGSAVLLATLTAGAGVLHLVMAPVHAASSGVEAAGFALAGWLQLALAAFLLLRPARPVLTATAAANLVFVAVWAVSRTVGLPVGPEAGVAEAVGAADLTTVVLELAAAALAALLLVRPGFLAGLSREALALGALLPLGALVVVTLVVVSPSTARHDHGDTSSAAPSPATGIAQRRCDLGVNPAAYWTEAAKAGVDIGPMPDGSGGMGDMGDMAGMDHGSGDMGHGSGHAGMDHHGSGAAAAPTTAPAVDPLQGRGSKRLDSIVSKLDSDSEADAALMIMALADLNDQEYEAFLYQLRKRGTAHAAHSASGDDTGGHGGHMGPTAWVPLTDQAQCDQLNAELALARETALTYPTVADAVAGGWTQVTPYVPGIGAHYMKFAYLDGTFKVDEPEMILYDGTTPEARVVGLSYYVVQSGAAEPTQGFTGDNDHYHRHIGLCFKDGVTIGPSTMSAEDCAAQGGVKGGGGLGWMSHAWVVPGCESPWGVFSGATPILDGQLGRESGKNEGGCSASRARKRYDLSSGASAAPAAAGPTEDAAGR